jgi:hypothetical protein
MPLCLAIVKIGENLMSSENVTGLACNILALAPDERAEHITNTKELLAKVQVTTEEADGYVLDLPLDNITLEQASCFVALERLCCPFLSFQLEVTAGGQSFWLTLTGPAGVKSFLQAELGEVIRL